MWYRHRVESLFTWKDTFQKPCGAHMNYKPRGKDLEVAAATLHPHASLEAAAATLDPDASETNGAD